MSVETLFDGYLMERPSRGMVQGFFHRKIKRIYRLHIFDGCLTEGREMPFLAVGSIGKLSYETNFNREFFKYQPPRPLAEIDAELAEVEKRIMAMLREVTE